MSAKDIEHHPAQAAPEAVSFGAAFLYWLKPVSYTHLTLPTIYSV